MKKLRVKFRLGDLMLAGIDETSPLDGRLFRTERKIEPRPTTTGLDDDGRISPPSPFTEYIEGACAYGALYVGHGLLTEDEDVRNYSVMDTFELSESVERVLRVPLESTDWPWRRVSGGVPKTRWLKGWIPYFNDDTPKSRRQIANAINSLTEDGMLPHCYVTVNVPKTYEREMEYWWMERSVDICECTVLARKPERRDLAAPPSGDSVPRGEARPRLAPADVASPHEPSQCPA